MAAGEDRGTAAAEYEYESAYQLRHISFHIPLLLRGHLNLRADYRGSPERKRKGRGFSARLLHPSLGGPGFAGSIAE
jgi:hypothetical protein